jgi:dTDP-4-dehydrorhamnose reductase
MKPKILLIGKNGQVGGELVSLLPQAGEVTALGREQLDLTKPEELRQAIGRVGPRIIVNAAAYTAVDLAEKEEPQARSSNAEAPRVMAEEAKKIGALLVHYSTDYVFDGTKATAYVEEDATNPLSVYGRTKLEGELAIRESGAAHLIFRTEWVYGRSGKNFLLTILRLASEREELRIVRDQIGAPTWCREVARGTATVIARVLQRGEDSLLNHKGIFHMTAGGATSWHEFAEAILEDARAVRTPASWITKVTLGRAIVTKRVTPITTQEYPTPARRPANSVLANDRLSDEFGVRLPDWRSQLKEVFAGSKPIDVRDSEAAARREP